MFAVIAALPVAQKISEDGMNSKFSSVVAWAWTLFIGIGSIGIAAQGHFAAAGLGLLSAAAACPPIWRALKASGFKVPVSLRWVAGFAAMVGAGALMPQQPRHAVAPSAADSAKADPAASMWGDFDETTAVTLCDQMVTATAVNRGSVDTAWRWTVSKDNIHGRATIERDFDAQNAMGGTISSRYRCVVGRTGKEVSSLSIRELGGWRKIM